MFNRKKRILKKKKGKHFFLTYPEPLCNEFRISLFLLNLHMWGTFLLDCAGIDCSWKIPACIFPSLKNTLQMKNHSCLRDPNCMIQIQHQKRKVWVPKICSQHSYILGINCACQDACLLWIKQHFRLLGHCLTSTTAFMHVSFCLPTVNDRLAFKCFCQSYICFGCQTKQAIMSTSK